MILKDFKTIFHISDLVSIEVTTEDHGDISFSQQQRPDALDFVHYLCISYQLTICNYVEPCGALSLPEVCCSHRGSLLRAASGSLFRGKFRTPLLSQRRRNLPTPTLTSWLVSTALFVATLHDGLLTADTF